MLDGYQTYNYCVGCGDLFNGDWNMRYNPLADWDWVHDNHYNENKNGDGDGNDDDDCVSFLGCFGLITCSYSDCFIACHNYYFPSTLYVDQVRGEYILPMSLIQNSAL